MSNYIPLQFIPENYEELSHQECSICLDELFESKITDPNHIPIELNSCKHRFHLDCIVGYCGNTKMGSVCECPLCKTAIGYNVNNPNGRRYFKELKNDYEKLKQEMETPLPPPVPIAQKKVSPPRKKSPEKSHASTSKSKKKSKNNKTKKSNSRSPSRSPPRTPPGTPPQELPQEPLHVISNEEKKILEKNILTFKHDFRKNYKKMSKGDRDIFDLIDTEYKILSSPKKTREEKIFAYTKLKRVFGLIITYEKAAKKTPMYHYLQQIINYYLEYDTNEGDMVFEMEQDFDEKKQEEFNKFATRINIMLDVLHNKTATEQKKNDIINTLQEIVANPETNQRIKIFIERELKKYNDSKNKP